MKALPRDLDRVCVQINAVWTDQRPEAGGADISADDSYSLHVRSDIKGGTSKPRFTGDENTRSAAAEETSVLRCWMVRCPMWKRTCSPPDMM